MRVLTHPPTHKPTYTWYSSCLSIAGMKYHNQKQIYKGLRLAPEDIVHHVGEGVATAGKDFSWIKEANCLCFHPPSPRRVGREEEGKRAGMGQGSKTSKPAPSDAFHPLAFTSQKFHNLPNSATNYMILWRAFIIQTTSESFFHVLSMPQLNLKPYPMIQDINNSERKMSI